MRYFYHPESGALFELENDNVSDEIYDECIEITKEDYEEAKKNA